MKLTNKKYNKSLNHVTPITKSIKPTISKKKNNYFKQIFIQFAEKFWVFSINGLNNIRGFIIYFLFSAPPLLIPNWKSFKIFSARLLKKNFQIERFDYFFVKKSQSLFDFLWILRRTVNEAWCENSGWKCWEEKRLKDWKKGKGKRQFFL